MSEVQIAYEPAVWLAVMVAAPTESGAGPVRETAMEADHGSEGSRIDLVPRPAHRVLHAAGGLRSVQLGDGM
jgi:hypothetical protein